MNKTTSLIQESIRGNKVQNRLSVLLGYFLSVLGMCLVVLILTATVLFLYGFTWSGFNQFSKPDILTTPTKNFWDWLSLIGVPLVILAATSLLNRTIKQTEDNRAKAQKDLEEEQAKTRKDIEEEIARRQANQSAFEKYLDRIVALDTAKSFANVTSDSTTATMISAITTVLFAQPHFDAWRKGIVVQFLYKLNLLNSLVQIDLTHCDLKSMTGVALNLKGINLSECHLSQVDFREATLENAMFKKTTIHDGKFAKAHLKNADFTDADLTGTDFTGADLRNVNFSNAILKDVKTVDANLEGVKYASKKSD